MRDGHGDMGTQGHRGDSSPGVSASSRLRVQVKGKIP